MTDIFQKLNEHIEYKTIKEGVGEAAAHLQEVYCNNICESL